ncbi:MAG: hypothetical protein U0800_08545 [Isosphaeraceae bacterium]
MGDMRMTIGQAAAKLGAHAWQIRNLIKKGRLPEPPRLGPFRTYGEADLPSLETALIEAGYLKAAEPLEV